MIGISDRQLALFQDTLQSIKISMHLYATTGALDGRPDF